MLSAYLCQFCPQCKHGSGRLDLPQREWQQGEGDGDCQNDDRETKITEEVIQKHQGIENGVGKEMIEKASNEIHSFPLAFCSSIDDGVCFLRVNKPAVRRTNIFPTNDLLMGLQSPV